MAKAIPKIGKTTVTAVSEFPAIEDVSKVFAKLDEHRRRQALAMFAERYGMNLPPSPNRVERTIGNGNISEFPAIEEAAEFLDDLTELQQELALAHLAGQSRWKIQPAYKPAPRGNFSPHKRYAKG